MESNKQKAGELYPWWVFLPIVAAPVMLFLPALWPGNSLFWGIISIQFIPWHWEALRSLQAGEIPLWNTLNGMGAPLAANYQSALFYPPTWITLLAGWLGGLQGMSWSHGLLIVLHLIWAGWGMKKLTEFIGLSPIPQVICGLSYSLCGYLVARGSFLTMVQAAAWIPWILYAASQIAIPVRRSQSINKSTTTKSIIWLALGFSGQWLSGHAQLSWYTLLFCLAWLVTGALVNGGIKKLLQIIAPVVISGLLGFLICSIQIFPTIDYFTQSQRSGAIDYQTALSYSFWPWRVITLIFPDIFGNPGVGNYWGYASFWEDAIYFGLLPLFFVFYYLVNWKRNKNTTELNPMQPLVWFCGISILIVTVFALGWNTPIFPWLFNNVPTFGSFNGPTRWMILVEICLILLGGLGAEEWMNHPVTHRKQINLGLTAMFALVISGVAALFMMPEIKDSFKFTMISTGLLLAGYMVLTLIKPVERSGAVLLRWRFLFILWLMVDLFWAGWKLNPIVSSDIILPSVKADNSTELVDGRYFIAKAIEMDQRFNRFFVFDDIRPKEDWATLVSTYLPDSNILSSVPMVNNFDPMIPDRYSNFMAELEVSSPEIRNRYLALSNTTHTAQVNSTDLKSMEWKTLAAYPRVRMVNCVEVVGDGVNAFSWLKKFAAGDSLETWIVVESAMPQTTACTYDNPRHDDLVDLSTTSNRQEYQVKGNPTQSWMFIADTWYPGWQAKLDGNPIELYRADYVFMALKVPTGDHRVELVYDPISFKLGTGLSILGLFGIFAILMVGKNSKGDSQ